MAYLRHYSNEHFHAMKTQRHPSHLITALLILLGILQLILVRETAAQTDLHWQRIGQRDLPSQNINDIAQDAEGYIWLATDGGLVRYDGHDFIIYSTGARNSTGLIGNIIEALCVDDNNTVWFSVRGRGLQRWNATKNIFESIASVQDDFSQINKIEDHGEFLWITVVDGAVVALHKESLVATNVSDTNLGLISHQLLMDSSYIASSQGAGAFIFRGHNSENNEERRIRYAEPYDSLSRSYTFTHIVENSHGVFAGGWDNAVHEIIGDQFIARPYVFPDYDRLQFSADEVAFLSACRDVIWVGTKFGKIFAFDPENKVFTDISNLGIAAKKYHNLLEASDKNIWLGTDDGLYVLVDEPVRYDKKLALPNVTIHKHLLVDQSMFIGTSDGLYRYDVSTGRLDHMMQGHEIYSIEPWNNNRFIIGTSKQLYLFDPSSKKSEPLLRGEFVEPYEDYLDPRSIEFSRYNDILISDSLIYASAYGHAIVYCDVDRTYFGYYKQLDSLQEHLCNELFYDPTVGLVLLGNDFGAHTGVHEKYGFCQRDAAFHSLPHMQKAQVDFINLDARRSYSIASHDEILTNEFSDIVKFDEGQFYISSRDGLYHLEAEQQDIRRVPIPISNINGIEIDNDGHVWGVSNGGVFYWNREDSVFRRFQIDLGQTQRPVLGDLTKLANGQFVINTASELLFFTPEKILNQKPDRRHITFTTMRLLRSNEVRIPDTSMVLHERDNNFSLKFTTFPHGMTDDFAYEYKIANKENQWSTNGANNEIIISNLAPGNYDFVVRAVNKNGEVVSEEDMLHIRIKPYWYKSLAFLILSAVMLLFATIVFVRFVLRQQRRVADVREHIARDLHDDIGSTLGSISIYSEAARQRMIQGKPDEAAQIIDKIGDNSRLMIEKMSDIVWSVNTGNESLLDLIQKMEEFARNVFSSRGLTFRFEQDEEIINYKIDMEKRKNLYLLFKEVIHNIIKHADARHVNMEVRQRRNKLTISIHDDGKGFDTNQTHTGNGLANMQARARELRAELSVDSQVDKGTTVNMVF